MDDDHEHTRWSQAFFQYNITCFIRPYKVNDLFYIYNKPVKMRQWKKVKFCVSNILSVVATGTNAVLRLE